MVSKFTGKERDSETGLDYFGARYYGSNMGRFLSPDEFTGGPVEVFGTAAQEKPGPLPYADITNPQSLNKYVYAFNNPLRYIDPDGHFSAPVHTWLTDEAAKKFKYSEKTQAMLVAKNLYVDRASNQLNNKEHGMSDAFTSNGKAREAIQKTIDGRLDNAVKQASSGELKYAISELGQGLHTVQDYEAHGGVTLLGHGGEAKNDNSPEKVRDALADSERFLQRFEQKLTTAVGQEKAQQILTNLKKVGDE
jgi:RHS repeat-associated protein